MRSRTNSTAASSAATSTRLAIALVAAVLAAGCGDAHPKAGPLDGARSFTIVTLPSFQLVIERSDGKRSILAAVDVSHPETLQAAVDRALSAGADGVLLTGIGAVRPASGDQRSAQLDAVQTIAHHVHGVRGGLAVVPLDAAELIAEPAFAQSIDGIAQRGMWFVSAGRTDVRQSAAFRDAVLPGLRAAAAAGMPVFTIDFASDPKDVRETENAARSEGFIPYAGPEAALRPSL